MTLRIIRALLAYLYALLFQQWFGNNSTTTSTIQASPTKQMAEQKQRKEVIYKMKMLNKQKQKTLVLDLDETLVHSSAAESSSFVSRFDGSQQTQSYTYKLDLYITDVLCTFFVSERPHVHMFMNFVCDWYKVIIFTASVQQYADPVIDKLSKSHKIYKRLFRESCTHRECFYVKDLSLVCDDLSKCIILDNSPISYAWHLENAIPVKSWIDDPNDKELLNLLNILNALRYTNDVRSILSLRFT